jgi:carboxylate-amine ligase
MSAFFHLFERFGVELEYMIVDRDSLDVRPIADEVLHAVAGAYESEVEINGLAWSNELVLHVIELKTIGPARSLNGLADLFQRDVRRINDLLAPHAARLMPTAAHPWMDPATEARLWPHEYNAVYEAFNRIFNCQGHGWSNLQCVHLNLPFANDEEFGRLHAAIRLLLPIMPALAASSPILDGRATGAADSRLEAYRTNSCRVPSIAGHVIPEAVFTQRDYEAQILEPIYRDLAPHDPDATLRYEWANARGAIARFMRNTIEIRVLDIQECPQADLAILRLIIAVLRALVDERWTSHADQCAWTVGSLEPIFLTTVRDAGQAIIADEAYLAALGLKDVHRCTAGDLWRNLFERLSPPAERNSADSAPLRAILEEGCLSRRILRALGDDPSRARLAAVYAELCDCLATGRQFGV